MANVVVEWAKDNPLLAGGAALAVVVIAMLATGGGSGESDPNGGGMGAAGVQAYYAAVANQAQAGAAIQTTQIKANAETNRALIAASYGLEATKVQQNTQVFGIAANERILTGQQMLEREKVYSAERLGANDAAVRLAIGNAGLSMRSLGSEQRGAIVQSTITGQVVPVMYKQPNPGNSAGAILSGIGDVAGSVIPFF